MQLLGRVRWATIRETAIKDSVWHSSGRIPRALNLLLPSSASLGSHSQPLLPAAPRWWQDLPLERKDSPSSLAFQSAHKCLMLADSHSEKSTERMLGNATWFLYDVEETGEEGNEDAELVTDTWVQTQFSNLFAQKSVIAEFIFFKASYLSWIIFFLVTNHIQLLAVYASSSIQIWLCSVIMNWKVASLLLTNHFS